MSVWPITYTVKQWTDRVVAEPCDVAFIASVEEDGPSCLPPLDIYQVALLETARLSRIEMIQLVMGRCLRLRAPPLAV